MINFRSVWEGERHYKTYALVLIDDVYCNPLWQWKSANDRRNMLGLKDAVTQFLPISY